MRRFLPPLTLFWQFFLGLLLAALLPLLATWFYARAETVDKAESLAVETLRYEAGQLAAKADGWLYVNYESLVEHADTTAIRSMLPDLQRPVLIAIANHQPWTQLAFTLGLDGISLTRSDSLAPINYSDRQYFKTAVSGQPLGQIIAISRTTNRPSWIFAVPIKDELGKVIGVLAKTDGLNELTDQLANTRIGDTGRALLFFPDGKLAGMTGAVFDKPELRDFSKNAIFQSRENVRGGVLRFVDEGRPIIAVLAPIRFGWLVAVQMDEAEALRPVKETDRIMTFVLLGSTVLALAVAAIAAPGFSRPLVRLTTIAEDMSRGHFDHEIPGVDRRDEIGALSRAIERMTRSLRLAMERLTKNGGG
jgi:methyl-accepting chemotaxis protein